MTLPLHTGHVRACLQRCDLTTDLIVVVTVVLTVMIIAMTTTSIVLGMKSSMQSPFDGGAGHCSPSQTGTQHCPSGLQRSAPQCDEAAG